MRLSLGANTPREPDMKARLCLGIALVLTCGAPHGETLAADLIRMSDGPFISGGGYYVAREKGYFKKLGIEIQHREFIDGAMSVPAFVSGELDIGGMTASAADRKSVV